MDLDVLLGEAKFNQKYAIQWLRIPLPVCLLTGNISRFLLCTVFIHNFRFWNTILANWWVVILFRPYHRVALPCLGKVAKASPFTPRGYGMAPERKAWGIFTPPPYQHMKVLKTSWSYLDSNIAIPSLLNTCLTVDPRFNSMNFQNDIDSDNVNWSVINHKCHDSKRGIKFNECDWGCSNT